MARFDKVARLAYGCFKDKTGYFGWIRVNRDENYIGIVICKCGDTVTDILYEPKERIARVMTFDQQHLEEDRFTELCKYLGVDAKVEYHKRVSDSGLFGLMSGLMARSPSGRVDDEQFKLMREFPESYPK